MHPATSLLRTFDAAIRRPSSAFTVATAIKVAAAEAECRLKTTPAAALATLLSHYSLIAGLFTLAPLSSAEVSTARHAPSPITRHSLTVERALDGG